MHQSLVDLRRDHVQFGVQHAAGQPHFGEGFGDAGQPAHRLDVGDGGFLPGVLNAAPDGEDRVLRGNE